MPVRIAGRYTFREVSSGQDRQTGRSGSCRRDNFDDDRGGMFAFRTCKARVSMGGGLRGITLCCRMVDVAKKTPALGKSFLANPVGQQPVVSNAHESFWQAVQQEPSNELGGLQPHEPLAVAAAVVFVTKGDLPVFQPYQPPVGDGHAMCIPGQILEYLLW